METVELPAHEQLILDGELRRMKAVECERVRLDEYLRSTLTACSGVQPLMTIPGMNHIVALDVRSAFGDVGRFQNDETMRRCISVLPP